MRINTLVLLLTVSLPVTTFGYNLVPDSLTINPNPQATFNTCQSYSIAFALSKAGWQAGANNAKELRSLEQMFRNDMDGSNPYAHKTWKENVTKFTQSKHKLIIRYVDEATLRSLVRKHAGTYTPEKGQSITFKPRKVVMTSITKYRNSNYSSGHIVSIVGIHDVPNKSKPDDSLLIFNSAIKGIDKKKNQCSIDDTKTDYVYSAKLESAGFGDIELKPYDGKYLVMWIE